GKPMRIEFHPDAGSDLPPRPGDVILRPKDPAGFDGVGLAAFVLARGIGALVTGDEAARGSAKTVIVPCDTTRPALDDMLAASIVRWLATGEKLLPGLDAFARYAALAREGLQPGDVPPEASLEGIYLAVRSD